MTQYIHMHASIVRTSRFRIVLLSRRALVVVTCAVKLRVVDPSGCVFSKHVSPVAEFLDYIGGEEMLPEVLFS